MVLAQGDHQADHADDDTGAERLHVDERAADEQQAAETEQDQRHDIRRRADAGLEPVGDMGAHWAAVPAEPEHGGEKEADRGHAEPPQLGVMM